MGRAAAPTCAQQQPPRTEPGEPCGGAPAAAHRWAAHRRRSAPAAPCAEPRWSSAQTAPESTWREREGKGETEAAGAAVEGCRRRSPRRGRGVGRADDGGSRRRSLTQRPPRSRWRSSGCMRPLQGTWRTFRGGRASGGQGRSHVRGTLQPGGVHAQPATKRATNARARMHTHHLSLLDSSRS